jgi:hypothetical protein
VSPILRVLGSTIGQISSHLTAAAVSNICAVVLSLPVIIVLSVLAHSTSLSALPLGVVLLLGVLPNPLLVGLQLSAHALTKHETLRINEQWQGVVRYWRLSLRAWLLAITVTAVILLNVSFYPRMAAGPGVLHVLVGPIEVVWLSALVFWLSMHLYVYPLLLRQERPAVVLAYRNAAVLVLSRPGFALVLVALWLGWLIFTSTIGLAYVVGLAVAATMQQNALARIVPEFGVAIATGA